MNRVDYIASISAVNDNALTSITVYLTLVAGYLIAGYSVGRNLSKTNLTIVSLLFVVAALLLSFLTFQFSSVAIELSEDQDGVGGGVGSYISPILLFLQIAGIIGALKFTLDLRK